MNVKLISENNRVPCMATSVYADSEEGRLIMEMNDRIFNVEHNSVSFTPDILVPVGSGT